MQEQQPNSLAGLFGSVDGTMVVHALVVVLAVVLVYHFLFNR